jgi:transposase-like protein
VKATGPKTLLEAIQYFADEDVCIKTLAALRWPDGVIPCPECSGTEHYYLATRRVWKCKSCKRQFSIKVGTIFEDSPVKLSKWLPAMWLLSSAKNGISSYELHRSIGVCQKTAWFMLHRIRAAMQSGTFEKLGGKVEADETFIGGKARNMHKDVKERRITGTGGKDKTAVLGLYDRETGSVYLEVVDGRAREDLHPVIKDVVAKGSYLFTDSLPSYNGLTDYRHQIVDHAVAYVEGEVHTNSLENFWSCLKRTLHGTYVSVEPFHLFRYLDEQAFRFNERKVTDAQRFTTMLSQVSGRRLTYKKLTGKEQGA